MELQTLLDMRYQIVAVILFCIGFATLFLHPNLIKKIIGLNLMGITKQKVANFLPAIPIALIMAIFI